MAEVERLVDTPVVHVPKAIKQLDWNRQAHASYIMKHEPKSNDTKSQNRAAEQRQRMKRKGRPLEPPTGNLDVDVSHRTFIYYQFHP